MVRMISVAPIEEGWVVRTEGAQPPQVFASGPEAERAARRLAEELAAAGEAVKIAVHLRDGSLAGRFLVPPALPEARPEPVIWVGAGSAERRELTAA
jgi:hypothetical protein